VILPLRTRVSGRLKRFGAEFDGAISIKTREMTMERFLGKYSPYLYALLRIVAGLMFALHGSQKLFGIPGARPPAPLASLAGVAGVIEVVAGLMIAIGLLAGYAAFIASGEMAVAFFKAHFSLAAPLPIVNQGELAVLYCFLFLYLASHGSGSWSVDRLRHRA
jgi:putative oxidoreductase